MNARDHGQTIRRAGIALAVVVMGLAAQSARSPLTFAAPSENVCPSCAYTTIQSAIDAATGNTTIYIAAGTYRENLHVPGTHNATFITLWATSSATVDGGTAPATLGTPVLTIAAGYTVVLRNLNITNGSATDGAGITNSGTLSLLGTSSVYGNSAGHDGGGIYNFGGSVTLHNASSVHDNGAVTEGAGITNDLGGSVLLEDTSSVYDNPFAPPPIGPAATRIVSNRAAVLVYTGGGIGNIEGTVTLEDSSSVHHNTAQSAGGIENGSCGIVEVCPLATLTIQDHASVHHNVAALGGGVGTLDSMLMLGMASVHDNFAVFAGGIFNLDALTLKNTSSVYGNIGLLGGGIGNGIELLQLFQECSPGCLPFSSRLTPRAILGDHSLFGRLLSSNQIPKPNSIVTLRDFSTVHDNLSEAGAGILNAVDGCATGGSSVRSAASPLPLLPCGVFMQNGSSVYHNSASETILGAPVPGALLLGAAGGGVANDASSFLVMTDDSSIHDNTVTLNTQPGSVPNAGGGIGNMQTYTFMFDRSSVYRNSAPDGAGIGNFSGSVIMTGHSAVHHNTASDLGGGMYTSDGTLTMTDYSSIDHNVAGDGGGIYKGGFNTFSLWGVGAVTFNKPNNCSPANSVPGCAG
jgi:hypothetical protein